MEYPCRLLCCLGKLRWYLLGNDVRKSFCPVDSRCDLPWTEPYVVLIVGEVESARGKLRAADKTGPAARPAMAAEAKTRNIARSDVGEF